MRGTCGGQKKRALILFPGTAVSFSNYSETDWNACKLAQLATNWGPGFVSSAFCIGFQDSASCGNNVMASITYLRLRLLSLNAWMENE